MGADQRWLINRVSSFAISRHQNLDLGVPRIMHREVSNFFGLGAEGIELGQEDPDMEQVTIEIPQGASAGQTIEFQLADGRVANATVPAGKGRAARSPSPCRRRRRATAPRRRLLREAWRQSMRKGGIKKRWRIHAPTGSVPGQTITVMLAGNRETLVQVPAGAVAGQTITIAVPALAGPRALRALLRAVEGGHAHGQ